MILKFYYESLSLLNVIPISLIQYLLRCIRFISVVDFRWEYTTYYIDSYSIHQKRNAHTKSVIRFYSEKARF